MGNAPSHLNDLMKQAVEGDAGAFGRLAMTIQDDLYRFAVSHGLFQHAADVVQETLFRAYASRRRWRGGSNAKSWLFGIAMNVIREQRRKLGVQAGSFPDELLSRDDAETASTTERQMALFEALQRLPDRQREAVVCRYLRQWDVRQTSESMGCAEGTVKAATAKALAKLREIMANQYE